MKKFNILVLLTFVIGVSVLSPVIATHDTSTLNETVVSNEGKLDLMPKEFVTEESILADNFGDSNNLVKTHKVSINEGFQKSNIKKINLSNYEMTTASDGNDLKSILSNSEGKKIYIKLTQDIVLDGASSNYEIKSNSNIVIDGYNEELKQVYSITQKAKDNTFKLNKETAEVSFINLKLNGVGTEGFVSSTKNLTVTFANVIYRGQTLVDAEKGNVSFDNSQIYLSKGTGTNSTFLAKAKEVHFFNRNEVAQLDSNTYVLITNHDEAKVIFHDNSKTYFEVDSSLKSFINTQGLMKLSHGSELTIDYSRLFSNTNYKLELSKSKSSLVIDENAVLNMVGKGIDLEPLEVRKGSTIKLSNSNLILGGTINIFHKDFATDMSGDGLIHVKDIEASARSKINAYIHKVNVTGKDSFSTVLKGDFRSMANIDVDFRTVSDISKNSEGIIMGSPLNSDAFYFKDSKVSVTAKKAQSIFTGIGGLPILFKPIISNSKFIINTVESYDGILFNFTKPGDLSSNDFYFKTKGFNNGGNKNIIIKQLDNKNLQDFSVSIDVLENMNRPLFTAGNGALDHSSINIKLGGNLSSSIYGGKFNIVYDSNININVEGNHSVNVSVINLGTSSNSKTEIINSMIDIDSKGTLYNYLSTGSKLDVSNSKLNFKSSILRDTVISGPTTIVMNDSDFYNDYESFTSTGKSLIVGENISFNNTNVVIDLEGIKPLNPVFGMKGGSLSMSNQNIENYYSGFMVKVPDNMAMFHKSESTIIDFKGMQHNIWLKDKPLNQEMPDIRFLQNDVETNTLTRTGTGSNAEMIGFDQSDFDKPSDKPFSLDDGSVKVWAMGNLYSEVLDIPELTGISSGLTVPGAVNKLSYKLGNQVVSDYSTADDLGYFEFNNVDISGNDYHVLTMKNYLLVGVDTVVKYEGKLDVVEYPERFMFEDLKLKSGNTTYQRNEGNVIRVGVKDTRTTKKWTLSLTLDGPIKDTKTQESVDASFKYIDKLGNEHDVKVGVPFEVMNSTDGLETLKTLEWKEHEGIQLSLKDPSLVNRIDTYSAEFTWTLTSNN